MTLVGGRAILATRPTIRHDEGKLFNLSGRGSRSRRNHPVVGSEGQNRPLLGGLHPTGCLWVLQLKDVRKRMRLPYLSGALPSHSLDWHPPEAQLPT